MAPPPAPYPPVFGSVMDTSVRSSFGWPATDPVTRTTLSGSTDPNWLTSPAAADIFLINPPPDVLITGLRPNTTYYFWATITTAAGGTSDYSPRSQVTTYANWTLPDPPWPVKGVVLSDTSIRLDWGGDGYGYTHPIDDRELWFSANTTPGGLRQHVSTTTWTGLTRGTTYYFWAKNHTRTGWSGFSAIASATTWNVPPAPGAVVFNSISEYSVGVYFPNNGDGGTPVLEWQFGYGLSPTAPQFFMSGQNVVTGLLPGTKYYFWGRGRNALGWGAWGPVSSVTTKGNAFVLVGNTWKPAVPYVKVNGIWQPTRPWSKIAGVWKETST